MRTDYTYTRLYIKYIKNGQVVEAENGEGDKRQKGKNKPIKLI